MHLTWQLVEHFVAAEQKDSLNVHEILVIGMGKIMEKKERGKKKLCVYSILIYKLA